MSGHVFQVDDSHFLTPYTYETQRLSEAGFTFEEGFCETADEVVERAANADVLWLSWKPTIDRHILEQLPNVRLVIRWGIGYEQIDVAAATELGVAVANAPTYGTEDVADHALTLLLALERRIVSFDDDMRNGGWSTPEAGSIHRLAERTVGLLGVGRIGAALARRARGLNMKVIGYDSERTALEFESAGVEQVSLDELATRSDYVSVHVPHTAETEGMVDGAFLGKMKQSAYLINTARGRVINEADLISALQSGTIAGAGLDVFETEPLPADHVLRTLPNVVLTPHYAGFSAEAWADLRNEVCSTTIDFLTTGWADFVINPEVKDRLRSGAVRG